MASSYMTFLLFSYSYLFLSSFNIQLTASIACTSGDCTFDCGNVDCRTVICTETATSCTVRCGKADCSHSTMYLAATQFNHVTCDGADACKLANFYCGLPNNIPNGYTVDDFDNKIQRCTFNIANNAMTDSGYIRCYHKIDLCEVYITTNTDAFKVSQFECELSPHQGICSMNCESSKSCGADTSRFECYAPNCECNNCGGLKQFISDTPPPSTWMLGITTLTPTNPTYQPTAIPTIAPTNNPTEDPTSDPTIDPTSDPTVDPIIDPTADPTEDPSIDPTTVPSSHPTEYPTWTPTVDPSKEPTNNPTFDPSVSPTYEPSSDPTLEPTMPTIQPTTADPTNQPSAVPTMEPTWTPTLIPTKNTASANVIMMNHTTTSFKFTMDDVVSKNGGSNVLKTGILWVTSSVFICICFCLLLMLSLKCHQYEYTKKKVVDMEIRQIKLCSVNSASEHTNLFMNGSRISKHFSINSMVSIPTSAPSLSPFTPQSVDDNSKDSNFKMIQELKPLKIATDIPDNDDTQSDGISLIADIEINETKQFGQMIGDNALSQQLMIDDIVNDMEIIGSDDDSNILNEVHTPR